MKIYEKSRFTLLTKHSLKDKITRSILLLLFGIPGVHGMKRRHEDLENRAHNPRRRLGLSDGIQYHNMDSRLGAKYNHDIMQDDQVDHPMYESDPIGSPKMDGIHRKTHAPAPSHDSFGHLGSVRKEMTGGSRANINANMDRLKEQIAEEDARAGYNDNPAGEDRDPEPGLPVSITDFKYEGDESACAEESEANDLEGREYEGAPVGASYRSFPEFYKEKGGGNYKECYEAYKKSEYDDKEAQDRRDLFQGFDKKYVEEKLKEGYHIISGENLVQTIKGDPINYENYSTDIWLEVLVWQTADANIDVSADISDGKLETHLKNTIGKTADGTSTDPRNVKIQFKSNRRRRLGKCSGVRPTRSSQNRFSRTKHFSSIPLRPRGPIRNRPSSRTRNVRLTITTDRDENDLRSLDPDVVASVMSDRLQCNVDFNIYNVNEKKEKRKTNTSRHQNRTDRSEHGTSKRMYSPRNYESTMYTDRLFCSRTRSRNNYSPPSLRRRRSSVPQNLFCYSRCRDDRRYNYPSRRGRKRNSSGYEGMEDQMRYIQSSPRQKYRRSNGSSSRRRSRDHKVYRYKRSGYDAEPKRRRYDVVSERRSSSSYRGYPYRDHKVYRSGYSKQTGRRREDRQRSSRRNRHDQYGYWDRGY